MNERSRRILYALLAKPWMNRSQIRRLTGLWRVKGELGWLIESGYVEATFDPTGKSRAFVVYTITPKGATRLNFAPYSLYD